MIYNDTTDSNNILGIETKYKNKKLHIFGIYKQPQSNLPHFLTHLETTLNTFKNTIYLGDFNINILKNYNNNVRQYIDLVNSNGHIILNKIHNEHATRLNNTDGGSIIDHIITDNITWSYTISLNDTPISDHRYIHTTINEHKKEKINNTHTKICIEYQKITPNDINVIKNSENIIELTNNIKNIITKYTKTIVKSNNTKHKHITPWISENTIDKINSRNEYFKLKLKYPNNKYFNERFKYYRNITNTLIKNNKKQYYSNKYDNNIDNKRKFWNTTNEILFNKSQNKTHTQITLKINNLEIENPQMVANEFNRYFSNVGAPETNLRLENLENLNVPNVNFHLNKTTPDEIKKILKSLNKSSSSGYDGIPIKFFKLFEDELAPLLSQLINTTFKTGIYPECLKIAKVTPIHKSGNKKETANYRPISVLPTLSKIYEKALLHRLECYLRDNNKIHRNQFGFVAISSTIAACTYLINFVDMNLDRKQVVGTLFLDISKAFDSVNHTILLKKLKNIGIENIALNLFKSFHINRKQFVQINKHQSILLDTNYGVAQGSMISAPEFSIYINDIFNLNIHGQIQMYADDAAIMYCNQNIEEMMIHMQNDINVIQTFLSKINLKINEKKSHFMIYDKHKQYNTNAKVTVNNNTISRTYQIKYLGLIIDSKLNWHAHIDKIRHKIQPIIFAIYRLRNSLHKTALNDIYNAHILSHLLYMNPIWNGASQLKIKELETLQNKAVKAMFYKPKLHPTNTLYTGTNIIPLHALNKIQITLLIFKIKNNYIKHNFQINYRHNIHEHETRQNNNIALPNVKTRIGLNTILYRGCQLFNNLPQNTQDTTSIGKFKHYIKQFYK